MNRIDIIRGTNPMISVKLKGVGLVPTFIEDVSGTSITRKSYFTIRHNPSQEELDPTIGELQVVMDDTGHVEDTLGNDFQITSSTENGERIGIAKIRLSRTFTKTLHDHEYLMQFNLIDDDEQHNMFPVPEKPMLLRVLPNVVDLTGSET